MKRSDEEQHHEAVEKSEGLLDENKTQLQRVYRQWVGGIRPLTCHQQQALASIEIKHFLLAFQNFMEKITKQPRFICDLRNKVFFRSS